MSNQNSIPEDGPIAAAEKAADTEAQKLWDELEAKDPGETPGSEAVKPDEDSNPQPQNEEPPDPWAGVSPELRAEYERVKQQARSDAGRIRAYQKQLDELRYAKPSQDRSESIAKVKQKIDALEQDYPELAAPMKEIAETLGEEVKDLRAAEDRRTDAAKSEVAAHIEAETTRLDEMAPGWFDYVRANGAAFQQWVNDQPAAIREAAVRNAEYVMDAGEAFNVVNSFRNHMEAGQRRQPQTPTQPQSNRRERQLAASASPRSNTGSMPVTTGIPSDADPQVAWDYFEELDRRKGARA